MLLEHLRTVFPLDRRNTELGLDAGVGNAGGEATENEASSRRTGAAEPRHTEANAANSFPSGLETRSGDSRAAGGHLPHDACEARRTSDAGEQSGHGTFRDQSKEGQQTPGGEPHVYGWAAMMTALTTDTALSAEDKQKVAAYTSSANSPETLLQGIYWSQFKKKISEGLTGSSGSVPWTPQTQPILCLIIKAMKARGAKEKFGQAPAGGNVRELQQMLDDLQRKLDRKKRRTAIADFLAATKDAKYCTDEYRRQRRRTAAIDLLDATKVTSSSSSVCCAGPCRGIHFAPEVCAATVPVAENISTVPAATYAETVPVMEYISPAPAGYTAPAALVEYVCPAPAVSIAELAPTVCAAHDAVVEYISPATAMSLAAPTPVQYATPVKHAAPEQYDAPMMTVNGVDLNRDGISDVLQQPQVCIRRLSNTEHLSSMEDQ